MTKVEKVITAHYKDMLDLNKRFIQQLSRPRPQVSIPYQPPPTRRKLTKKQVKALSDGRKKLAKQRSQVNI